MSVVLYGINNCDTIKKAKRWLAENDIEFNFHDYRKDGLSESLLNQLEDNLGWQAMINKRGTTWRKLAEETKSAIDKDSALALMAENPAIIKRPILAYADSFELGFSNDRYQQILIPWVKP